jgi:hypothetical protein
MNNSNKENKMKGINTPLGKITHRYWFEGDFLFRVPVFGGEEQTWNGAEWIKTTIVSASSFKLAA